MSLRSARLFVVVAILIAGCSSTQRAGTPQTPEMPVSVLANAADASSGEWISRASNAVLYLSWTTDSFGSVVGTLQFARIADDGLSIESVPRSVSGVLTDGRFTLDVGGTSNWTGTINGDNLEAVYSGTSGELEEVIFVPGTVAEFNEALSELQVIVTQNVAAANDVAAQDAATAQRVLLFSNVRSETISLDEQIAAVSYTSLDDAVALVAADADAVRALGGNCDELPYAVGTVGYDVSSVEYETSSLQFTSDNIALSVSKLQTLVDQLDLIADSDDTYFAVSAGREAIAAANSVIADITQRNLDATATASSIYASVEPLDDSC
jgi:hypothetical protein